MSFSKLLSLWPRIGLAGSLLLVALLAAQARSLRQENITLRADLGRVWLEGRVTPVGLRAAEFHLRTLGGDSVVVGTAGKTQILLFLNTTCGYCRENLALWNELTRELAASDPAVAVLGVTVDPEEALRPYVAAWPVAFDIALLPDSALPIQYRAEVVPLTVLVGPDARVIGSRAGLLSRAAIDSLLEAVRPG